MDTQFEEVTLAKVREEGDGWSVTRDDGWSFYIAKPSPITPAVGMKAKFYGRGIGYPVRGVELDGVRVFYRTERVDKHYQNVLSYGSTAKEWLERWGAGQSVWSVEMGGLGPGYEQAIQITVAEVLRHMIEADYDVSEWEKDGEWPRDRDKIEAAGFQNETIKKLGLSGAQWGAAVHLAARLYKYDPIEVLTDEQIKDRKIQVSRNFPG